MSSYCNNQQCQMFLILYPLNFYGSSPLLLRAADYPTSRVTTPPFMLLHPGKRPSRSHFIASKSWWHSLLSTLHPTKTCSFFSFHFQLTPQFSGRKALHNMTLYKCIPLTFIMDKLFYIGLRQYFYKAWNLLLSVEKCKTRKEHDFVELQDFQSSS